jgi:hypothetical protein
LRTYAHIGSHPVDINGRMVAYGETVDLPNRLSPYLQDMVDHGFLIDPNPDAENNSDDDEEAGDVPTFQNATGEPVAGATEPRDNAEVVEDDTTTRAEGAEVPGRTKGRRGRLEDTLSTQKDVLS